MFVVLSPAKSLNFEPYNHPHSTTPVLLDETVRLLAILKRKRAADLGALMSISDSLAQLNFERYQAFSSSAAADGAKPAVYAFQGDVYQGLKVDDFDDSDLGYAQAHLRILSGLYGLLRPLDLIQPYRLEMGTALKTRRGSNLYAFWGQRITTALVTELTDSGSDVLVNLASNEYFKSVKAERLPVSVVTPVFKEERGGTLTMISFFAKKARGMMAAFIIKKRIRCVDDLLRFDCDGYRYNAALSRPDAPLFTR